METVLLEMIKIVLLILIVLLLLQAHVLDALRIIILESMGSALQSILFAKLSIKQTETVFHAINPISSVMESVFSTLTDLMTNALHGSKVSALHAHLVPLWIKLVNAKK